jgi:hypothetical protein
LISVRLGALQMDEHLQDTLAEYWKAFGEKLKPIEENPQQAPDREQMKRKQEREKMINSLSAALAHLQEKGKTFYTPPPAPGGLNGTDVAMLRLIAMLERMLPASTAGVPRLPAGEAYDRDTQLESLLQQLRRQLQAAQSGTAPAND